tara:strand:+ start:121 stop:759 length:639 start_codon:yes stop_codon:yes gene_type:complete
MKIDINKCKPPFTLFGNGQIPHHKIPLNKLKKSGTIISVDGGADKLKSLKLDSHIILGDLDSLKRKRSDYKCLIFELKNQSKSDLEKSLDWCILKRINKISLIGFNGGRFDHEITSLLLLEHYSNKIQLKYYSDHCEIHSFRGLKTFESFKGQVISIFSLNLKAKISTRGLKYNLEKDMLNSPSNGVSNISIGNRFSIDSTSFIFVFQNYKK